MRWGPRLIDIDILFYGAKVPFARTRAAAKELFNRAFVLAPLAEIAPTCLGGRSVAAAAAETREGVEKWFKG